MVSASTEPLSSPLCPPDPPFVNLFAPLLATFLRRKVLHRRPDRLKTIEIQWEIAKMLNAHLMRVRYIVNCRHDSRARGCPGDFSAPKCSRSALDLPITSRAVSSHQSQLVCSRRSRSRSPRPSITPHGVGAVRRNFRLSDEFDRSCDTRPRNFSGLHTNSNGNLRRSDLHEQYEFVHSTPYRNPRARRRSKHPSCGSSAGSHQSGHRHSRRGRRVLRTGNSCRCQALPRATRVGLDWRGQRHNRSPSRFDSRTEPSESGSTRRSGSRSPKGTGRRRNLGARRSGWNLRASHCCRCHRVSVEPFAGSIRRGRPDHSHCARDRSRRPICSATHGSRISGFSCCTGSCCTGSSCSARSDSRVIDLGVGTGRHGDWAFG